MCPYKGAREDGEMNSPLQNLRTEAPLVPRGKQGGISPSPTTAEFTFGLLDQGLRGRGGSGAAITAGHVAAYEIDGEK